MHVFVPADAHEGGEAAGEGRRLLSTSGDERSASAEHHTHPPLLPCLPPAPAAVTRLLEDAGAIVNPVNASAGPWVPSYAKVRGGR